jgi:demethylmenaquinone methyltransferase/2-methoxy-6-polyprenyl-1,4-benzoquinol methylase
MLAQAHAQTLPNPRLSWMEADVLQLPLAAASLDGVTMAFGLRNILDLPRCFQELHRMLRPGAKAVILDLCRRQDNGFQSWYLREIVPRLGAAFGLRDQFAYLAPSLERFPTPAQQADYAQQAGFTGIQHRYVEQGALHFLILDK